MVDNFLVGKEDYVKGYVNDVIVRLKIWRDYLRDLRGVLERLR